MKSYLILLLIFLFALFQATFLPLNLVLLTVLAWVTIRPARESLIIAFFAGILLDLAKGTPLGLSSLILLIASFLVILYRRRFDPLHPVFLPIFTLLSAVGYSEIVFRLINWPAGLILAVFAFLARLFMKSFSTGFNHRGIRLKIE